MMSYPQAGNIEQQPLRLNVETDESRGAANLTLSSRSLKFWNKVCCLAAPCTGFTSCLYLPCMAAVAHNKTPFRSLAWRRRFALLTFVLTLAAAAMMGLKSGGLLKHGLEELSVCEHSSRDTCKDCVDFVAHNVTVHHHGGKGKGKGKGGHGGRGEHHHGHHHGGEPTTTTVAPSGGGVTVAPTVISKVSPDARRGLRGLQEEDDESRRRHHRHGKGHGKGVKYAWPRGSRQACVAGAGHIEPFNSTVVSGETLLALQMTTETATTTRAITNTTFLDKCHKDLITGAKTEADLTAACSYATGKYPGKFLNELDLPLVHEADEDLESRFHFTCRREDDCMQICSCLGGELLDFRLYYFTGAAIFAFWALSTLGFVAPKLYGAYKALCSMDEQVSQASAPAYMLNGHIVRGDVAQNAQPMMMFQQDGVALQQQQQPQQVITLPSQVLTSPASQPAVLVQVSDGNAHQAGAYPLLPSRDASAPSGENTA